VSESGTETLELAVSYELTVEDLVTAGKYDWSNDDIISGNFPTDRKGKFEGKAYIVHCGRFISSEDVLAELDKMGLRAAELHELLALGVQHPDKQRDFIVAALGSVWQRPSGDRSVPYLGGWSDRRGLFLGWLDGDWYEDCRFLAFRK